ncbi:hypothetical protein MKEN_00278000 [Mycena kentingensis (nom. inval.)]|nr:hypothetical protein MKEN_00278000 [Mycena kentingensis (nom. inval.)]
MRLLPPFSLPSFGSGNKNPPAHAPRLHTVALPPVSPSPGPVYRQQFRSPTAPPPPQQSWGDPSMYGMTPAYGAGAYPQQYSAYAPGYAPPPPPQRHHSHEQAYAPQTPRRPTHAHAHAHSPEIRMPIPSRGGSGTAAALTAAATSSSYTSSAGSGSAGSASNRELSRGRRMHAPATALPPHQTVPMPQSRSASSHGHGHGHGRSQSYSHPPPHPHPQAQPYPPPVLPPTPQHPGWASLGFPPSQEASSSSSSWDEYQPAPAPALRRTATPAARSTGSRDASRDRSRGSSRDRSRRDSGYAPITTPPVVPGQDIPRPWTPGTNSPEQLRTLYGEGPRSILKTSERRGQRVPSGGSSSRRNSNASTSSIPGRPRYYGIVTNNQREPVKEGSIALSWPLTCYTSRNKSSPSVIFDIARSPRGRLNVFDNRQRTFGQAQPVSSRDLRQPASTHEVLTSMTIHARYAAHNSTITVRRPAPEGIRVIDVFDAIYASYATVLLERELPAELEYVDIAQALDRRQGRWFLSGEEARGFDGLVRVGADWELKVKEFVPPPRPGT